MKTVALLATGEELTQGDVLNTNAAHIARALFEKGIAIGLHLVVSDDVKAIESAITFLLQQHDALIITGGLGPTSDDRTRDALSAAIQKPLCFHEASWQHITTRIARFFTGIPPESNRQQAFFPEGAVRLHNPNGTAEGCKILHQGKWIFMLPGPPPECLPMFQEDVLKTLLETPQFARPFFCKKWLLFGASEGHVAPLLDECVSRFAVQTGFRIAHPYLEFKIYSTDNAAFLSAIDSVKKLLQPYLLGDGTEPISMTLKAALANMTRTLIIDDRATGGRLAATLLTPQSARHLHFKETKETHLRIEGLVDYWQGNDAVRETTLSLTHNNTTSTHPIPYRGERTLLYAVEVVCQEILKSGFGLLKAIRKLYEK